MEFFYIKKQKFIGLCGKKMVIYCVNPKKFLFFHKRESLLKLLSRLVSHSKPFAITSCEAMDGLLMYSVLNLHPVWVGVAKRFDSCLQKDKKENYSSWKTQAINLIEAFNINLDLGGLPNCDVIDAIKLASRPFIITDFVLSGFCGGEKSANLVEHLVGVRKSLLLINIDGYNIEKLKEVLIRHIKTFGVENLALCYRFHKHKLKKLQQLLASELTQSELNKIFYYNAHNRLGMVQLEEEYLTDLVNYC